MDSLWGDLRYLEVGVEDLTSAARGSLATPKDPAVVPMCWLEWAHHQGPEMRSSGYNVHGPTGGEEYAHGPVVLVVAAKPGCRGTCWRAWSTYSRKIPAPCV